MFCGTATRAHKDVTRACQEPGEGEVLGIEKREGSRTKTSHDKSVLRLHRLLRTFLYDKPYGFSFS